MLWERHHLTHIGVDRIHIHFKDIRTDMFDTYDPDDLIDAISGWPPPGWVNPIDNKED